MLLLESDRLHESEWVRHEISFAHSHRITLLALTMPNCTNRMRSIDDAFRLSLNPNDLTTDRKLTDNSLASVLDQIELAHYHALRRRREQILESVTQKLSAEGCHCHLASDWCILATKDSNNEEGLFWVTPRRPETTDFFGLSQERERLSEEAAHQLSDKVVHASGPLGEEYQKLMDWLAQLSKSGLTTIERCRL